MTASPQDNAEHTAGLGLRTGRWQVPDGRAATEQVRRTVHGALRRWGLGPVAGELTDQMTALVHEFLTRTADRARGPIDLRLEFRASARLLLGEICNASPVPSEPGDEGPGRAAVRGIVALTYGRRHTRNGNRYIHSFAWWQPDALATDR